MPVWHVYNSVLCVVCACVPAYGVCASYVLWHRLSGLMMREQVFKNCWGFSWNNVTREEKEAKKETLAEAETQAGKGTLRSRKVGANK